MRTLLCLLLCVCFSGWSAANDVSIGVYYYPGWTDGSPFTPSKKPWAAIESFPDRKPQLGWYKEGSFDVIRKQMDWMRAYGIDYIVFDWYYNSNSGPQLTHALDAYEKVAVETDPKFALLWANHDESPVSLEDWDRLVNIWIAKYFHDSRYLSVEDQPVVFILSIDRLESRFRNFDYSSVKALSRANAIAKKNGLSGIRFVAGVGSLSPGVEDRAKTAGYSYISAYNFHNSGGGGVSLSFKELDQGYRSNWERLVSSNTLPVILPLTAGWDRRPWGGSLVPSHDNSSPLVGEFREHLKAARDFCEKKGGSFLRKEDVAVLGKCSFVLCCWNEYGEGSFVEPTVGRGKDFLEDIKAVFGNSKRR